MAIRKPAKLNTKGERRFMPPEALFRAVSDNLDRTFGTNSGHSFTIRSGLAEKYTGSSATKSRRHLKGEVTGDFQLWDPNGRQLAGRELETFGQNWTANYGSIGINSQPGELGRNFTHLDFVRRGPAASVWTYGKIPGLRQEEIEAFYGTGDQWAAWSKPDEALTAFGGPVAVNQMTAMKQGGPVPPGDLVPLGNRTLKLGTTGEDVRNLQRTLAAAGLYKGKIDGDFGPQTKAAVEAYQADINRVREAAGAEPIDVDGRVGAETRPHLLDSMAQQKEAQTELATTATLPSRLDFARAAATLPQAPNTVGPDGTRTFASLFGRDPLTMAPRNVEPVARADLAPTSAVEPPSRPRPLTPAPLTPVERRGLAPLSPAADPTTLSRDDFLRRVAPEIGAGLVNRPTFADEPRGLLSPEYIRPAPARTGPTPEQLEAAKQQIRDQQGFADLRPLGFDPRNPPVEAGNLNRVGDAAEANRLRADQLRQTAVQNLRGNLLAGQRREPQIAFNSATGRGPQTMAPTRPAALGFGGVPAARSVSDMVRGNGAPLSLAGAHGLPPGGYGSARAADDPNSVLKQRTMEAAARAASSMAGRPQPSGVMKYAGSEIVPKATPRPTGTPMAPSGMIRQTLPSRTVGYAPGFSAKPIPTVSPPSPSLTPAQQAAAARYAGLAASGMAGQAVPGGASMGIPVSPDVGLYGVKQPMGQIPQAALAAGLGLLTGGPMGAAFGFGGSLLKNALGRGGLSGMFGGDPRVAAMNAAVARNVQSSDLIGGNAGNASYGRKQSDGSVTGRTSTGTGYTSRDGGKTVSVGGKTYRENKNGRGYSRVF